MCRLFIAAGNVGVLGVVVTAARRPTDGSRAAVDAPAHLGSVLKEAVAGREGAEAGATEAIAAAVHHRVTELRRGRIRLEDDGEDEAEGEESQSVADHFPTSCS